MGVSKRMCYVSIPPMAMAMKYDLLVLSVRKGGMIITMITSKNITTVIPQYLVGSPGWNITMNNHLIPSHSFIPYSAPVWVRDTDDI